jgi:hypothetical protein
MTWSQFCHGRVRRKRTASSHLALGTRDHPRPCRISLRGVITWLVVLSRQVAIPPGCSVNPVGSSRAFRLVDVRRGQKLYDRSSPTCRSGPLASRDRPVCVFPPQAVCQAVATSRGASAWLCLCGSCSRSARTVGCKPSWGRETLGLTDPGFIEPLGD